MEYEYIIIYTTCNNEDIKQKIIESLLDNKLCACIQVSNIDSFYKWNNELQYDKEISIKIKTKYNLFDKVRDKIKEISDYQTSQIIATPIILGNNEYLDWIDDSIEDN